MRVSHLIFLGLLMLIPRASEAADPHCTAQLRRLTEQGKYFDILKDGELLKPNLTPEEASFAVDVMKAVEFGTGMRSLGERFRGQSPELLNGLVERMNSFVQSIQWSQVRYTKEILLAEERVGKLKTAIEVALEEQGLLNILVEKGDLERHRTLEEVEVTHQLHTWIRTGKSPSGFKAKLKRQKRDFQENLIARMRRFIIFGEKVENGVIPEAVKRASKLKAELDEDFPPFGY